MLRHVIFAAAVLSSGITYGAETPKPSEQGIAGKATLAVSVYELEAIAVGYSAKKMILGKPVFNGVDEKPIGKVSDVIIAQEKSVSYAIVDVGGFLGMGAKQVAIPAGMFKMDKGKIILADASKEALKELPEFKYAK